MLAARSVPVVFCFFLQELPEHMRSHVESDIRAQAVTADTHAPASLNKLNLSLISEATSSPVEHPPLACLIKSRQPSRMPNSNIYAIEFLE